MFTKTKRWKRLVKAQFNKRLLLVEKHMNASNNCASQVPFENGYWPYEINHNLREDTLKHCGKE